MKKIFYILFIAFLYQCTNNTDFYNQALQKSTFNLDSTEIIILVPGSGCSGCITGAEHFITKYFNRLNKVKFILTNIQSYKILRLKLGEEAFHSPLLYLDKNNIWHNMKNDNNIYPQVLFINNKKIIKIIEISPYSKSSLEKITQKYNKSIPIS